ncbi:tetratricopeptide repeat family protein [Ehrlichia chaffeensis str. Heartland]|uniref:HemY domain protein n=1 Tax=Ehrlichia chaffeensis (strain ATCC CRL-10679 / Arkansas) TaxID=205920 RepID=Q2GHX6_EHRCR|nr:hypothetical protein [Ehrlichia chaffeensis]ABD45233.1 HemY domain protein [Ehrlichia chaffeensis str. Arkansas]AHX04075.1 tetratricopeptide repeat family protein [Ehrlichia chaffeensis str. Heartland]AHX06998.1 tetratricopeptide repeat family protein [Ehrlichia chaffeensis str. Liberty]AHX10112.1 tetratricopeptide repeat family protein [Ehrlichia chaffeensis str. West Paces]
MITSVLIFVIVALTIGLWVIDCDGIIRIDWLGYDIEVNILFTLFVIAVVFLLLILLVRFIFCFSRCVYRYKRDLQNKKMVLLEQGYMYLNCGDVERVEKIIVKIGNFDHPSLFLLKGRVYFDTGKYILAEKYFTQFVKVVPVIDASLGIHLLNVIMQIEDQIQQLSLLRKMLEIFFKQSWSAIFKLTIYRISRDWGNAIEEMKKIIKLKINLPLPYNTQEMLNVFYYALAKQCYDIQKYDDGLRVLDNIKNCSQQCSTAVTLLKAKFYIDTDKKRKAVNILEHEYRINPHPDIANFYLDIMQHSSHAIHKLYSFNTGYYFSIYLIAQDAINSGEYDTAMKYLNHSFKTKTYISLYFLVLKLKVLSQNYNELLYWTDKIAKDAIADKYWSCTKCKYTPTCWHYECDGCKSFNTIIWV